MNPISGLGPDDTGDPGTTGTGGQFGAQVFGGQTPDCDQDDDCHLHHAAAATGIPVGRRAAARLRLALPARIISLYGVHRCILIDLSTTGAQLGLEAPLATSENAILEIAGKEFFCDIVRVERGPHGGVNGVTFDPQIKEQDVLDVRRFSETYQTDELRAIRSEVRAWVNGSV